MKIHRIEYSRRDYYNHQEWKSTDLLFLSEEKAKEYCDIENKKLQEGKSWTVDHMNEGYVSYETIETQD